MKRVLILLIALSSLLYGEEFTYRVKKNTTIYSTDTIHPNFKVVNLKKGSLVTSTGRISQETNNSIYIIEVNTKNHSEVWVDTDSLEIINSEVFPNTITDSVWVLKYYEDILQNPSSDEFYKYEPYWEYNDEPLDTSEGIMFWFDRFYSSKDVTRVVFEDIFIEQDGMEETGASALYNIKSIKMKGNKYIVDVKGRYKILDYAKFGFIQKINDRKDYRFILEQDGDYLTIYLNDESNVLVELIAVDDSFIEAICDAAMNYIYEKPTNINWPKRASEK